MKFFICAVVVLIASLSQQSLAAPLDDVVQSAEAVAAEESGEGASDIARFKKAAPQTQGPQVKSSYGGAAPVPSYSAQSYSVPAPGPAVSYSYQAPAPMMPCARNLLVSCSPSVAPVPCAAPSYSSSYSSPSSYGSAGAYSEIVPQWAVPAMPRFAVPTVRELMYGY